MDKSGDRKTNWFINKREGRKKRKKKESSIKYGKTLLILYSRGLLSYMCVYSRRFLFIIYSFLLICIYFPKKQSKKLTRSDICIMAL